MSNSLFPGQLHPYPVDDVMSIEHPKTCQIGKSYPVSMVATMSDSMEMSSEVTTASSQQEQYDSLSRRESDFAAQNIRSISLNGLQKTSKNVSKKKKTRSRSSTVVKDDKFCVVDMPNDEFIQDAESKADSGHGNTPMSDTSKQSDSQDISREEERWTEKTEQYLMAVKKQCEKQAKTHDKLSRRDKRRYYTTAVPAVVLPLLLANTSEFSESIRWYVNTAGLSIIAIVNGVQTVFNFGKRAEVHNNYSNKYSQLATDIQVMLTRGKRFRLALDVFMERVTVRKRDLDDQAPFIL